jgi:hypothetical protein
MHCWSLVLRARAVFAYRSRSLDVPQRRKANGDQARMSLRQKNHTFVK